MTLSHRAFGALSMAASAALALAAAPAFAQDAAAPAGESHLGIPVDRIGLVAFTIREQIGEDPRGTLQAVTECGIDVIEFSGSNFDGDVPSFQGVPVPELQAFAEEFGFSVPSLGVSGDDLRENLDDVIAAAEAMGASYVRISGSRPEEGQVGQASDYTEIANLLNEVGPTLRDAGITVAYHNHDWEFVDLGDGTRGYDILLAETDPESVAFELDLYWTEVVDVDAAQLIQDNPGRFPLLHVKDAMAETDPATEQEVTFATVGQGTIDFQPIFDQSEVGGVEYYFIENDRPMPDGTTSACEGYAYLASETAPN